MIEFNNLSSAGTASITSNGVISFIGNSTAANATIVSNFSGGFDQNSSAGHAIITNNGGWSFFGNSTAASATLVQSNTGGTNFNNTSSAGNATVVNNGSFQFNDSSTAGSANITTNSRLFFSGSSSAGSASITNTDELQFFNTASAGNATITHNGSIFVFSNSSTAGNATIASNSILNFNNSSAAGNATITSNSQLNFFNSASAGSATITSNGLTSFNGSSTAGNATITNSGSIFFADSSNGGNATIVNNGGLFFENNSTAGNAAITTNAGAATFFSGFFTGFSNPAQTAGSIAGAGSYDLGANQLTVGSNNLSTEVSGVISGTGGSLVKTGMGTLTLSGTNTYTGATTINGGGLLVNGSIGSSSGLTVASSGLIGGAGVLPGTTINGGTLAPGNSIGTITIQGNLVLTAASAYMVEVSGTTSDKTVVTGTAIIAGNVSVKPLTRVAATTTYTILTSTGTTGTFAGVTLTSTTLARNARLSYSGNDVLLTLDPGTLSPGLQGNANANQRAAANGIDNALLAGTNLPTAFNALFNLTGDALLGGLTQVSGQGAAAMQTTTFDAMSQFVTTMTDPFNAGRSGAAGGASGYAPDDAMAYARKAQNTPFARVFAKAPPVADAPRWSIWAAGFGGSQTTDGVAAVGSNNTTSSLFGLAAGADYRFSPNTVAGFALAGGGTNFRTANLGSGRSDLFQAGAFVRHNIGAAYLAGAFAYGWQDVTTDRTLTIAGVDRLRASFSSNALTGRIESGYRFVAPTFGGIGLTPYAAGQVTTIFLPGYAEAVIAGANTFALAYASRDVTATRSELGLRADKSFVMDSAILTLRGRAAWAHNFDPDRSINATFQSLPGASFTVNGAAGSRNTALTTASAELRWLNGWSVAGTFEGEFSHRTRSYAGKGVVRYVW